MIIYMLTHTYKLYTYRYICIYTYIYIYTYRYIYICVCCYMFGRFWVHVGSCYYVLIYVHICDFLSYMPIYVNLW